MNLRLILVVAIFSLGFVFGGTVTTLRLGSQVDKLLMDKMVIEHELAETKVEIEELKKVSRQIRASIITETEIEVVFNGFPANYGVEMLRLGLTAEVKRLLSPLIGQQVSAVNYTLILSMLNGRLIDVEGQKLTLKLITLVIAETVLVQLEAAPYKGF